MRLLIGSQNPGKLEEIGEALSDLSVDLVSPRQANIEGSPTEAGSTLVHNAILKAQFYFTRSALPTLADDSGLFVDALKDEMGVHTRRWGPGSEASDEVWIAAFLDRMRGEVNRKAEFACVLCFIDAQGKEWLFEGKCRGTITDSVEAPYLPGLPVSSCFRPQGYEKVFSALTAQEKNAVSHRGKALQGFHRHLRSALSAKAA